MRGDISDIVTQEKSCLLATHITHILATLINASEKFSQQGWDYVCVCYVAAWGGNYPPCSPARYGPGQCMYFHYCSHKVLKEFKICCVDTQ